MIDILLIIFILVIPAIFHFLLIPKDAQGSDHFGLMSQVVLIKNKNNKIIYKRDNWLYNNVMIDPQLFPWLLSFLPEKFLEQYGKYIPIFFTFLSSCIFFIFLYFLFPHFKNTITISCNMFLIISGLIYISNPFSYNFNNAKNIGLSSRGFGLFFVHVYLYMNVLLIYSNNYFYLGIACFSCLIIILSSKFGFQFIILFTPIFSLLFINYFIVLELLVAMVLFVAIDPKYAKQYLIGQLNYRIFYSKYLAKIFLFSIRYSIWRDFVWDFWVLLFEKKHSMYYTKKISYFINNSVLISFYGFPFLFPVLVCTLLYYYNFLENTIFNENLIYFLLIPIFASFIIFISTTFRITRFLGEPERYLEFVNGFISIVACIYFFKYPLFLSLIILLSLLFILSLIYFYKTLIVKKIQSKISHPLENIHNKLLKDYGDTNIRLMSNNMGIAKMLGRNKRKILYGAPINPWIGSFRFEKVLYKYPIINSEMIVPLIKEFNINFVVLDLAEINHKEMKSLFNDPDIIFNEILNKQSLILFSTCIKI